MLHFFGYSHKEAQTLDPKSRVLHEVAYHALEDAGYAQRTSDLITGVFVGRQKMWIATAFAVTDWRRCAESF